MDVTDIRMRTINNDIYIIIPTKKELKIKFIKGKPSSMEEVKKELGNRLVFMKQGIRLLKLGGKANCNKGECCALLINKSIAKRLTKASPKHYSYIPFEWQ